MAHQAGAASHLVAAQLGHESVSTTLGHYTRPEAVQAAQQERTMRVLQGGKSEAPRGSGGLHFDRTINRTGADGKKVGPKNLVI